MSRSLSESDDDDIEDAKGYMPILDETGMAVKGPYDNVNPVVVYSIMQAVLLILGYLAGWGIYAISPEKYQEKIANLKAQDLGYLYIATKIMNQVLHTQQIFVAVGRKDSRCDNPDQYVYKTMLRDQPYVKLEMEGAIGEFNRAQRGIDNTREVFACVLVDVVLGGYVFPIPMLILTCVYFLARIMYIAGYVKKVGGRMAGGGLSFLSMTIIGGMQLFAGIQALL